MDLLLAVGLITGFLGALFGLGGGFILVPLLVLTGYGIHSAVGTSSASIVFTALSATVAYHRQRKVKYRVGFSLAAFSIFGAYVGAALTDFLPSRTLKVIFGVTLILMAIRMMNKRVVKKSKVRWIVLPGGFSAGLFSGLLGVGGGIVNVPVLLGMGLEMHEAVATSSFVIVFTATSSTLEHIYLGNVVFKDLIWLVPGIILGAQLGAYVAERLKAQRLKIAFSAVMIFLAIRTMVA